MITGSFGQIREAYLQARLLFPDEVIQYILQNILASSPSILDVGCGTGIGTRQLHENGAIVMGSDVDATMITTAQKTSPDIPYIVAPAHNLPFKDEQFDAVTAFSAFHWFTDEASLTENDFSTDSASLHPWYPAHATSFA